MQLTITLGDVLQVAATIGALVVAYIRMSDRLTAIETKIDPIWEWFWQRNDRRASSRG